MKRVVRGSGEISRKEAVEEIRCICKGEEHRNG